MSGRIVPKDAEQITYGWKGAVMNFFGQAWQLNGLFWDIKLAS